ncbi:MAG: META domain-containing protein [Marinobacter sp.]|nr:META domain-containing protein [Marinobacter sp.]
MKHGLMMAVLLLILSGCAMVPVTEETTIATLTNTYWKLVTMQGEPVVVSDNQREAHLILTDDLRIHGFSGCNRFMGEYRLQGTQLEVQSLASTRMACVGDVTEGPFLQVLANTAAYWLSGDELRLLNTDGEVLGSFRAVYLR